jgi:hypothetical protein
VSTVLALPYSRLPAMWGTQLGWDEHFGTNKSYASFSEKSRILVVPTVRYLPGDAHYCVSAIDVITLRWNGSRFAKKATHAELSNYGVHAAKKL